MNTVNQEYRNQHEHRNYPFADDATLAATNGTVLPTDFVVDALLYPIDLENGLYMQSVDYTTRTVTLADTVTGKVHGVAVWDDTDTAYVYEPDAPRRMVGVITFGPGRSNQSVGGTLTFTPATGGLTPTAFYPLNQQGVRGIQLEDDTYYTGAIRFEGRNGVSVHTYVDDSGRSIIEFMISGVTYEIEPCYECHAVRCIRIVTSGGSYLVPADCAPNMLCVTSIFELDNLCPPSNISLPSKRKDPCAEPVDCDELTGAAPDEFYVCPTNGRIYITAPSTADYNNPLWIVSEEEPAPPVDHARAIKPIGLTLEERQRILDRMFDATSLSRGRITIEYRGLTTGRHY
jgi:hypothetical protein